ncbi:MAG: hypothetical protein V1844_01610 [Pseudomonadota bacterium]
MRKNGSNQNTKEIQFSLEAVDARKISLTGGFNNGNPDSDSVSRTRVDEPPDTCDFMQKIPCFPHVCRNEPNYFHF